MNYRYNPRKINYLLKQRSSKLIMYAQRASEFSYFRWNLPRFLKSTAIFQLRWFDERASQWPQRLSLSKMRLIYCRSTHSCQIWQADFNDLPWFHPVSKQAREALDAVYTIAVSFDRLKADMRRGGFRWQAACSNGSNANALR